MSGYLYFDGTGSDEIDEILSTLENAGHAYHNTADWTTPDDDGLSERDRIQIAAGEAAETITRLTAARAHIGRDLMQIRERIAEIQKGELAGLQYAEQLLGTTLARLQPEEGDSG